MFKTLGYRSFAQCVKKFNQIICNLFLCLVKRIEKDKPVYYANLATGNFNKKTAGLYCDHSIFTAKKEITNDLVKLFRFALQGKF